MAWYTWANQCLPSMVPAGIGELSEDCMEYARLETSTLMDVTDDYYYGSSCQSCLHTSRLRLSKLRSHLGADFPLRKIRERLKCQICSSRKVTITFLGPHQRGGNLHHLFDKQAR